MATSYLAPTADKATSQEVLAATDGGVANANKMPTLNDAGQLTLAMMPPGIGPDTDVLTASETLAAGAFVNVFSNNGTPSVRNAVASGLGFMAHGYVLAGVAAGQPATVYFDDNNSAVTGRTVGTQYLSLTPGQTQATPPTGAGKISQNLGVAVTPTIIHASIDPKPIVLAQ